MLYPLSYGSFIGFSTTFSRLFGSQHNLSTTFWNFHPAIPSHYPPFRLAGTILPDFRCSPSGG